MCLKHLVSHFQQGKGAIRQFQQEEGTSRHLLQMLFREISLTPFAYSWVPSTLPHSRVYLSRNRSI